MKCQNCGTENAADAEFCGNCGASFRPVRRLGIGVGILLAIAGIVLGFCAAFFLAWAGGNLGERPGSGKTAAIIWILGWLLGLVFLIGVLGSRRGRALAPPLRVLALAALIVFVGGMTICSVPAVVSLFIS